jgi:hypothetical protein
MTTRLLISLSLILVIGLATVHQRLTLVRLGYREAELRQTQQELRRTEHDLRARLLTITAPTRAIKRKQAPDSARNEEQ